MALGKRWVSQWLLYLAGITTPNALPTQFIPSPLYFITCDIQQINKVITAYKSCFEIASVFPVIIFLLSTIWFKQGDQECDWAMSSHS